MKKTLPVLSLLLSLCWASCDSDNAGDDDRYVAFKVNARFALTENGDSFRDKGAKFYVFYNIDFNDESVEYEIGGVLKVNGAIIPPDKTGIVKEGVTTDVNIKGRTPFTAAVESAKYPGKYEIKYFRLLENDEDRYFDVIFQP